MIEGLAKDEPRVRNLDERVNDHEERITTLETNPHVTTSTNGVPEAFHQERKYSTNFEKTKHGNGIKMGKELVVKIKGAESVSGSIKDHRGNLLIIDQSHAFDEDNDAQTINFKLKHRRFRMFRFNLPPGDYFLKVVWWDKESQREGSYADKFAIVR